MRAHAHAIEPKGNGATQQTFDGPGLVCGEAFGLMLKPGEHLTRRDFGIDFLVYYIEGPGGPFTLYEGNAPQPHDDEIRTGLSFPSVIAIHDNRNSSEKRLSRIKNRLLVGVRRTAMCGKRAAA